MVESSLKVHSCLLLLSDNLLTPAFRVRGLRPLWRFSWSVMSIVALTSLLSGCNQSTEHSSPDLPAALRDDFSYQLAFYGAYVWEPGCLQIEDEGVTHRIVLIGVDAPEEDQPFGAQSIDKLRNLVSHSRGRIEVLGRDQYQRELGRVFAFTKQDAAVETTEAHETDVGLQLIKLGLAKCSEMGQGVSDDYREAEDSAFEQRLGIWSTDLPPGE